MFSTLVHLILSLSISYPYLIKFHDFVDNSQEEMKLQMRGATQAQQGMITLMHSNFWMAICCWGDFHLNQKLVELHPQVANYSSDRV
jgi:hypothetical protein